MNHTLRVDWKTGLLGLTLVYLAGPLPLVAYGIQHWAASSRWDWRDRWASVRAFSVLFGLFYLISLVLLLLLLPPFATQGHLIAPTFSHISQIVASSIFPPGVQNILVRWAYAQPLAPILALIMERRDPRSAPYHYLRVELPGEIPEPEPVAVTTIQSQPMTEPKPKRRRTTPGSTAMKKKKTETTTAILQTQATEQTVVTAEQPRPSLWEQIDWSQVSEDNPLRQQAMEEAHGRKGMHIQYVEQTPETAPTPPSLSEEDEQPSQDSKPKKRVDWSKVDE